MADMVSLGYTVEQLRGPESASMWSANAQKRVVAPSLEVEVLSGALNMEAQHGLRKGQYSSPLSVLHLPLSASHSHFQEIKGELYFC